MVRRFRLWENDQLSSEARSTRQLIVAVSANVADSQSDGFDCVCPKPLSRADLSNVVLSYLNARVLPVNHQ